MTADTPLSKAIVGDRLQLASQVSATTVNSTDVSLQVEDLTELKEFVAQKKMDSESHRHRRLRLKPTFPCDHRSTG